MKGKIRLAKWLWMLLFFVGFGGVSPAQNPVEIQEWYRDGANFFREGKFEQAGIAFATSYDLYPNQRAALMAARSYAAAGDTSRMVQFLKQAMEQGRYVFDQPEFEPFVKFASFQKILKEANLRLEYMRAEVPEPRFLLPYDYEPSKSYPLVIFLPGHGAGANLFEPGYLEACNEHQFIWMVVRGSVILGEEAFSWEGNDGEIKRIHKDLMAAREKYKIAEDSVFIFGYDVGGTAAWQYLKTYPETVSGLGQTQFEMPSAALIRGLQEPPKVFVIPAYGMGEDYQQAFQAEMQQFEAAKLPFRVGEPVSFFRNLDEMLRWFLK